MQQCQVALHWEWGVEEGKMAQDKLVVLESCCVMLWPGHSQSVEATATSEVKFSLVCWSAGVLLHLHKDKWGRRRKQKESSMSS